MTPRQTPARPLDSPALVTLDRLIVQRQGIPLFREITLTVQPGDVVRLVGHNGAGKSTILKILAGMDEPDLTVFGICRVLGFQGLGESVGRVRAGCMLIRQVATTYRGLTVAEQLNVTGLGQGALLSPGLSRFRGTDVNREAVQKHVLGALREFGLVEHARVRMMQLSLGQRRAVCLAGARVRLEMGRLKLLLLDEPQSSLDVARKTALRGLIEAATARGCGVIVAEHFSADDVWDGPELRLEQAVTFRAPHEHLA